MKTERFTASRAARQMACHASANLSAAIPGWTPPVDSQGAAAKAGTSKHEMLEPIWTLSPTEMEQMAQTIQYVADLTKGRRFNRAIEETFMADWLAVPTPTKPDLVLWTQQELHVLDTKMGKIPVSVHDNAQLMFGALCVAHLAPKAKGVTVHILQAAAKNFESTFITADQLAAFRDEAIATEAAIAAGDKSFGPSDHCKFCPAFPHSRAPKGSPLCPAQMKLLGYGGVAIDEDAILNG